MNLTSLNVNDLIQDGILIVSLGGLLAGALNRWAVANHKDRLASITSAGGNAAGRVLDALTSIPKGVDAAGMKAKLVRQAAKGLTEEFASSGSKISLTEEKAAGIILGQLGQIPGGAQVAPFVPVAEMGLPSAPLVVPDRSLG